MAKKLLIAGGDSWTSPHEHYYKTAGMDKIWPNYVAEFFDWDLLNVAMGGAGNDYIHNTLVDAIEENSHRDIVVMPAWSQAMRSQPFDLPISQLTFNVHMPDLEPPFGTAKIECQVALRKLLEMHVTCHDPRGTIEVGLKKDDFSRYIARWSIRYIYLLNEFCLSRGIEVIHHRALNILNGIEWILDPSINFKNRQEVHVAVRERDNPLNQYLHKIRKWDNVVGGDLFEWGSSCYELYPKYWLSQDEHHPNAQGMQLIAHSFVNKYIEKYQERATAEADYVYD
jgi:hypothetical protein